MNTRNDLFKEKRHPLNSPNPPKSFFTIEFDHNDFQYDDAYPYHYHDWYELYYMQHGSCTYRLGDKSLLVNDNSFVFIPPNVSHKAFYNSEPHQRYLMYFSKDYMLPDVLAHINSLVANPVYIPRAEDVSNTYALVQKLHAEFQNPTEFSQMLIKCHLYELFVLFLTKSEYNNKTITQKDSDLRIEHVVDYIKRHYADNITLNSLA